MDTVIDVADIFYNQVGAGWVVVVINYCLYVMFHHFWQLNWLHIVYNFLFKFLLADSLLRFNYNSWLYGLLLVLWLFHFLYDWLIVIIFNTNYVALANRFITTVDNIYFVLCT